MPSRLTPAVFGARLKMLQEVRDDLEFWFRGESKEDEDRVRFGHVGRLVDRNAIKSREEARKRINGKLLAVKQALRDVGLSAAMTTVTISAPLALGGRPELVDPLTPNLFTKFWDVSPAPMVLDLLEQAIGAYESLAADDGLIRIRDTTSLDALQALMRGLRSGFRDPPSKELQVHDVAETILVSHAIQYTRDKEVAVIGDRSYKPDFHLVDFDLPLEFKLCDAKKLPNDIQEQICADIAGYRARWDHAIFIVYDVGQIESSERFCEALEKKFDVTVRVVKH